MKKAGTYLPLLLLIYGWFSNQTEKVKAQTKIEYLEKALADSEKNNKTIENQWRDDVKEDRKSFLEWVKNQKPIIAHATNTVREYEKTTAGQSVCLDPDGVQRFQTQRRLIEQQAGQAPTTP